MPAEEYLWLKPAAIALFIVAVVAVVVWSSRRSKAEQAKRDERDAAERERLIAKGVATGQTNEYGQPLCMVCDSIATHSIPLTGRMWIDKVWGLRLLNTLTAMPWRYSKDANTEGDPSLCAAHRRSADHALDQAHSQMRSEHARFNAAQHAKISTLEQGGLVEIVRHEADQIRSQLGLGESLRGILDSSHPRADHTPTTHVLTASSASDDEQQGNGIEE